MFNPLRRGDKKVSGGAIVGDSGEPPGHVITESGGDKQLRMAGAGYGTPTPVRRAAQDYELVSGHRLGEVELVPIGERCWMARVLLWSLVARSVAGHVLAVAVLVTMTIAVVAAAI